MGFFDWIRRWLLPSGPQDPYHGEPGTLHGDDPSGVTAARGKRPGRLAAQIAQRLNMPFLELTDVPTGYQSFTIAKRNGHQRRIDAPNDALKQVQRGILKHVLSPIRSHPAVHGFEKGRSIATNAAVHCGQAVVIRLDIRDFFHNTSADRIREFFLRIGWDKTASKLLTRLTTYNDRLPQGAATSPRLANLVNYRMDLRLSALAESYEGRYTRYADDLTFSLAQDVHRRANLLVSAAKAIVSDCGYSLHQSRKLQIRRRHQRQEVTGLCVNERVRLPRESRRRLRAIRHRLATTGQASLTPEQLAGWDALEHMIATQSTRRG
jgi:retron-type reverse transcriptase